MKNLGFKLQLIHLYKALIQTRPDGKGLYFIKAELTSSKDGLYMLVLLASPRWRWCPGGSIQNIMLLDTSEYSPGHQRHLEEANKTNIYM